MTRLLHAIVIAAATAATASAHATIITVTPQDMGGAGQWSVANVRADSSAAITGTNARNGNGSVEMSLKDGNGKGDFSFGWGYDSTRTLGTLTALSYDWYRAAGGSAPAHLQPALRLVYDADGDRGTTDDLGYLVWELEYNGGGVVDKVWTSSNIIDGNFWMRQFTPGNTVENYGTTLLEWVNGPRPGAPADALSANTAILGIEFGIGSGWNGSFTGFVDNVTYGFAGNNTTFNFETRGSDVPEPGSFALLGLGLVAVAAAARKRRQG